MVYIADVGAETIQRDQNDRGDGEDHRDAAAKGLVEQQPHSVDEIHIGFGHAEDEGRQADYEGDGGKPDCNCKKQCANDFDETRDGRAVYEHDPQQQDASAEGAA